ncbi:MAG TPA: SIMPL domain-containing protein, partial [Candidatus Sulfotelmatobacter sp.]
MIISQLDHTEEIVSGLVDAGADEITAIEFHTAKLKELRARELATHAAREKAEIYAAAGKVSLGEIVHIQDVQSNVLRRREFHAGAAQGPVQNDLVDNEPEQDSLDPSAIEVGAAVLVAYRIAGRGARKLASLGGSMPQLKKIPRRSAEND